MKLAVICGKTAGHRGLGFFVQGGLGLFGRLAAIDMIAGTTWFGRHKMVLLVVILFAGGLIAFMFKHDRPPPKDSFKDVETVWVPTVVYRDVMHVTVGDPEKRNIEAAERVNLYYIRKFGQSVVPPVLEQLSRE